MTRNAIEAAGVWKEYEIGATEGLKGTQTLYDVVGDWLRAPLRRMRSLGGRERERFWALRDVGFDIREGEAVGLIGRNGAGKSTLLKILSRITAPTRGRITLHGRLASLLEVGTGFHPELTGRENIYLNGAIMGMKRREVDRKFDEIVAFAGVEKFVDTPVKRYSSGMYVRLAFAVAAHLEADILVVDEVLAVGDAAFQRKSLNKMGDVARLGRTVLFVSHNLAAIRNLCTRSLVFEHGQVAFDGGVAEGVAQYERSFAVAGSDLATAQFQGVLVDALRFETLIYRQNGEIVEIIDPALELEMELRGAALRTMPALDLKISFFRDGVHLASMFDADRNAPMREGAFVSRITVPGAVFQPGRYTIGIGAVSGVASWVWGSDVAVLDVSENRATGAERSEGLIAMPYRGERFQ
ncbi:MAG TPA: ABC transporter ATP-binding protein [Thermoanaerobaculia bacterium]|nr:ABC transporter ATP-binding protein [Thermoanaerobaculia bacterium]